MSELEQSRQAAVQQDGFNERLLSVLESLRPGVRQLSQGQQAVLLEYAHIKEQLAGPSFSPLPPQITGFDTGKGKLRIIGTNLRGASVVHVFGVRVTEFGFREGEQTHIETDLPRGAAAGPITVLTPGGSATRYFRIADSAESQAGAPPKPPQKPPAKADRATKGTEERRRPEDKGSNK